MSSADHGRILYLDGWRGLAILTVLVGHFFSGAEMLGGFGVDLFFVLSGRLMAQILIEDKFPLPTFFLRRFTRIYPALFVFATAMLCASLLIRAIGHTFNSLITPFDYFAALTMWMNYKVVFFGEAGVLDHLWSISVEEHSYIILASLSAVLARKRGIALVILGLAIVALANGYLLSAEIGAGPRELWRTDVRVAPLFMSFAIYLSPIHYRKLLGRFAPLMLSAAFVMPFTDVTPPIQLAINSVLLGLSVNSLDYSPQQFRRFFEGAMIRFIGVISYSLYLWQQPLFTLHERVSAFILLPIVFIFAIASYYLIEQPSRTKLNSLIKRRYP